MNLAYHYPIVYWNTACLSINGGADSETEDNKSTAYGRIGIAIAQMQKNGIKIGFPEINSAKFEFDPDEENNQIIFALKGINGIGDDVARTILDNRPYKSMFDFAVRMLDTGLIKRSQMVSLIKAGCFTKLDNEDRSVTMDWYLSNYVHSKTEKLTMQQFAKMKERGLFPDSCELAVRMVGFKSYVLDDEGLYKNYIDHNKKPLKRGYHDRWYVLDANSQPFFIEHFDERDCVVTTHGDYYVISEKAFLKQIEPKIAPLRQWFASADALNKYNLSSYLEIWDQYASGSLPHWSMQALTYYDAEHELDKVDEAQYGIVNFFDLPEDPVPYTWYTSYIGGEQKQMPKYKIDRIAGTVLNADNNHHTVALLTKYGVVNVKFSKGIYAFYNRRLAQAEDNSDKKHVIEESWFKRGSMLIIAGNRRGDQWVPRKYADTIYKHTVNLILEVNTDGTLVLQTERTKVE